ncbi:hypothetical protein LTR86_001431 [Recurvomyces mirabilis]|nr:hypothetical protein LTR86_001431 [Recurvomyces mirabilis]
MPGSKFIEMLDGNTTCLQDGVSLEEVLAETRQRSTSSSSESSESSSGSSETATSSNTSRAVMQPAKTRLRGFSLRKIRG